MFGRKNKSQHIESTTDPADKKKEEPVFEPYQDEPTAWENLPGQEKAQVWYQLALTYERADPGDQNPEGDNYEWYLKEAAAGNRCAQYAIGKMYYKGVMTVANPFQAGLWFAKASEAGCPFADYELGKMCEYGISMPENKDAARIYYQKAYDEFQSIEKVKQNKAVELKLAIMCENKLVDSANPSEAKHWRDLINNTPISPSTQPQNIKHIEDIKSTDFIHSLKTKNAQKGIPCDVPTRFIFPADDNKYSQNDTDEDIYALAVSIQTNGLINPITLNKISETEFKIISGERRYKAISKYLGWETIPSIVYEKLSPNMAQLMLHSANMDVREYSSGEKLQFYIEMDKLLKRMKESGEYSGPIQKGISELMGISTHQIRKYRKIIESLSAEQVQEVVNGNLSIERAYKFTLLSADGCTSAFESKPDVVVEQETGRTSALNNPKSYEDAISLLQNLPIAAGQTCAIVNGNKVDSGVLNRVEIYENTLLLSVLVNNYRQPYPVSMLGKSIFIGDNCFEEAQKVINTS